MKPFKNQTVKIFSFASAWFRFLQCKRNPRNTFGSGYLHTMRMQFMNIELHENNLETVKTSTNDVINH